MNPKVTSVELKRPRAATASSRDRRLSRDQATQVAAWVSILLVSCALAYIMSGVVSASVFQADASWSQLATHCAASRGRLLYVGLNSWIPAQACSAPSGQAA
jgi:hypothetical protein